MTAVDARFQRRVQRYGWDKAVAHYERFWARQLEPAQDRLLEMAALQPGERVADVACGTGLVTFRAAAQVGPRGRVAATDISDEMVAAVRRRAEQEGARHVTAERRDAEDLGQADGHFDAALCALGLMYAPDPQRAVAEMHRLLRPGGRAVSVVWGQRDRCGWAEIFPIVDARVQSEVCPMFFQLGTGRVQERTFEAAGFESVETQRLTTVLHYASAEEALGAAFAGGPVALAYARFDESTRAAAHAEYLASIERYRHGDRWEVPGEFVITRGVRR
jgi:ubiquinone/menaquinone biosynthesis C-methylase UbiE